MPNILTYLLNLSLESYHFFVWCWLALGLAAAVSMYFLQDLPISSKVDNITGSLFGGIDKRTGWIIMETPILITVLYFYIQSSTSFNFSMVMVIAFVIHYTNRALIYPHRIKAKGKQMAVSSMLLSMVFYTINGYLIGYYFGALKSYSVEWLYDPRFLMGISLFISGFLINIHSDNILINLRKPGETEYKIPQGGFYRWLSCPNYFGEIIEWIGFALMTWSLPGFMYAIWVGGPLISQSISAHRWYVEKFGEAYPENRKALIPGVF